MSPNSSTCTAEPNHRENAGIGPYLALNSVRKAFGDFVAVRDISVEVNRGEFACFVGPSGCGKTTLLRIIAGLEKQTAGVITQAGVDVSDLPPNHRDFGIVFQSYALFPNLTVRQNIAFGLENLRRDKDSINNRIVELLDMVGLQQHIDKYPSQLSGGEQQRVALARSLAPNPSLLLLDEPLSALDAQVRVTLRREIKELQRRLGVTTIMVTHDQEEALTMADRVVVMNQGNIEQVGTPIDVYRHPATAFVADFIGTMNLMPVVVAGQGRVLFGSHELSCGTDGIAQDTTATATIRPEDIIVVHSDEACGGNILEVRLTSMEFLGAFYRVELSTDSRMGNVVLYADFSMNEVRRQNFQEGDVLRIALPSEHLQVYPENKSHG